MLMLCKGLERSTRKKHHTRTSYQSGYKNLKKQVLSMIIQSDKPCVSEETAASVKKKPFR